AVVVHALLERCRAEDALARDRPLGRLAHGAAVVVKRRLLIRFVLGLLLHRVDVDRGARAKKQQGGEEAGRLHSRRPSSSLMTVATCNAPSRSSSCTARFFSNSPGGKPIESQKRSSDAVLKASTSNTG